MPHNHLRLFLDQVAVAACVYGGTGDSASSAVFLDGNSEWNTDASDSQVC
jgi:hypothetical protein